LLATGWVPKEKKHYCAQGTEWLKENVPVFFNGEVDQEKIYYLVLFFF
jgi:hypothetical protein